MTDTPSARALAFDLDGTLVDSAPDIEHALNQALAEAGLPGFALAQVRAWIGDGPDLLIERALVALGLADRLPLRRALREGFDRATLAAPLAHGFVYDGIAELLQQLRPRWPLVVITNKPTPLARAVLDAAALLPHFHAVHGADTPALRKPAPGMLQNAAHSLGLRTAQLLMVGDSKADLGAAAAAGSPVAWAGWGYGHADDVPQTVRWRIAHPRELPALLAAGPQPR